MPNLSASDDASYEALKTFLESRFSATFMLQRVSPTTCDLAYLEEHGRFYEAPSSFGLPLGDGSCYENSANLLNLTIISELKCVQGFVINRGEGIIIPRAWCTDEDNNCIETTWDCATIPEDVEYFGVAFTKNQFATLRSHFQTYDWYVGFASVLSP